MKSHLDIEKRSIILHQAIADKIIKNPSFLEKAKENLHRWSSMKDQNRSSKYFKEWEKILEKDVDEILKIMVENTEQMHLLRQSSPFTGILTPQERWKIYETFRAWTYH